MSTVILTHRASLYYHSSCSRTAKHHLRWSGHTYSITSAFQLSLYMHITKRTQTCALTQQPLKFPPISRASMGRASAENTTMWLEHHHHKEGSRTSLLSTQLKQKQHEHTQLDYGRNWTSEKHQNAWFGIWPFQVFSKGTVQPCFQSLKLVSTRYFSNR